MADSLLPVRDTLTEIARLLPIDASLEDVQYHLYVRQQIADQSPAYAESVYERILERPLQLTVHPSSGSLKEIADLRRPNLAGEGHSSYPR